MASYEVRLTGAQSFAKVRSPVWVVVLSAVTLYIYVIFWWYYVNRELRDLGRARGSTELGDSPGTSALAVSLGSLVIVPPLVSAYRGCQRIQAAGSMTGQKEPLNGWIALILFVMIGFFYIPFFAGYLQSELNKIWRTEGVTDPREGHELLPPVPASTGDAQTAEPVAEAEQVPSGLGQEKLDRLERLAQLRDSGALSSDEFEAQKAKILADL